MSARGLLLALSRHRQVHQMEGGGTRAHNIGQVSYQVHRRAGFLLSSAQPHHHRQWQTVHQWPLLGELCLCWHQNLLRLRRLPAEQWTGGTRKC
jgi:hypothetical protein